MVLTFPYLRKLFKEADPRLDGLRTVCEPLISSCYFPARTQSLCAHLLRFPRDVTAVLQDCAVPFLISWGGSFNDDQRTGAVGLVIFFCGAQY